VMFELVFGVKDESIASFDGAAEGISCSVLVIASGDGTLDSKSDDAWLSALSRLPLENLQKTCFWQAACTIDLWQQTYPQSEKDLPRLAYPSGLIPKRSTRL
jgi:hypothetical protein